MTPLLDYGLDVLKRRPLKVPFDSQHRATRQGEVMLRRGLAILLLSGAYLSAQVLPGSTSGPQSVVAGQIQTATGGGVVDGTLTFTLSQPAIISGTATLATQTVSCYTSTSGNVVGLPDSVVPPVVTTNTVSGTLAAGTYYVQIYYINAASAVSEVSPEAPVVLTSQGTVIVNAPALHPSTAAGYGVAIGTAPGTETIQGTVTGFGQYQQATPLITGSIPQATNNSSCNVYFSDVLVPTGTYYTVNLINANGSQIAGFPQSWCMYGGATGTINVSQGAPTGCNTNGVFYPTPILASPSTSAQSVSSPIAFPGGITGSPNFFGAPLACAVNGRFYIGGLCNSYWGNVDLGAQANSAAGQCVSGQQCHIVVFPSTQLTITTPIVYVPNETLECVRMGIIDNTTSSDAGAILKYSGTGTAITMGSVSGRFKGCDLLLGSTVANGVLIGGGGAVAYSNHIDDASIRGGGATTILVHISCPSGGVCEDNHLSHSRISDFIGVGVAVDYANDTYLYDNTVYAKAVGNTTSTHLIVDSSAGGVSIDNFIGGSVGLHGFVERKTLGGNFPTFIFANNMEMDGTSNSSECWLFDSTLQSANVDATFMNSWAAGCNGPGIHISGGSGIHIGAGSRVRLNQKDGILIDVTGGGAEYGTTIADSYIQGNNQSNGVFNGISITGHPGAVTVTSNHINNFPEVGGFQQYAVAVTSGDVEGLVISNNDCDHNVVGCFNAPTVTASKITVSGNVTPSASAASAPVTQFPGALNINNSVSVVSSNGIELLCSATLPTITSGFNAGSIGPSANGTCSFFVTVGTGSAVSTGVLALPTATSGWNCFASNFSRADYIQETGNSVTSVTLTNMGTGFSATNWTNGDIILISCFGR